MSSYVQHFGLSRPIFTNEHGGEYVFESESVTKAVALTRRAFTSCYPALAVIGPTGCGKSTTIRHALKSLDRPVHILPVGRIKLQADEVLELICGELDVPPVDGGTVRRIGELSKRVKEIRDSGQYIAVVVEDAVRTGADVIAELDVLCGGDAGADIGLVLCGGDNTAALFKHPDLLRTRQRLEGVVRLAPLGAAQMDAYVKAATAQAGGDYNSLFENGFSALLHRASEGVPRVARKLLEATLSDCAVRGAAAAGLADLARVANDEFGLDIKAPAQPAAKADAQQRTASPPPTAEPEPRQVPETSRAAEADTDLPVLEPTVTGIDESGGDDDHDDLPDLKELTAEFAAVSQMLERLSLEGMTDIEEDTSSTQAELAAFDAAAAEANLPAPEQPSAPASRKTPQAAETKHGAPGKRSANAEPTRPAAPAEPLIEPTLALEPDDVALAATDVVDAGMATTDDQGPQTETADDGAAFELSLEQTTSGPAIGKDATKPQDDTETADWDRDPTLAELRPDLDALELALAEEAEPLKPEAQATTIVNEPVIAAADAGKSEPTLASEEATPEDDGIPEITLDNSIQEKVEQATAEAAIPAEGDGGQADSVHSDTEIHRIVERLSQSNSIEDMDDKMAETLFGEELSLAASQILRAQKKVEEEKPPAPELRLEETASNPAPSKPAAAAPPEADGPGEHIELSSKAPRPGMDTSASQRLATLRALNANLGKPMAAPPPKPSAGAAQKPAAKPSKPAPVPIEDQMDISMTATFRALKIDPKALEQEAEEAEDKKGFFSRFRKKG